MANDTYQCPECGLHYKDKELAKKCEAFCKAHHACSMDITKYSVEETERLAAKNPSRLQRAVNWLKPETKNQKLLRWSLVTTVVVVLLAATWGSYLYAMSPAQIRTPKFQHYHFRMQVLVNGQAENFGDAKYQVPYDKNSCSADLTTEPLHFHDNKNQIVHVHWDGMTGGMVLKYYGWNFIGGLPNSMGYKVDDLSNIRSVPLHGKILPAVPAHAKFYVFMGDQSWYLEQTFDGFLKKDLEDFFEKQSNLPAEEQATLLNMLFAKASAHGGVDDGHPNGSETQEQRLQRINNLLGNVVIFVQKDRPSDAQIRERFSKLEPLTDSTCGG
ncbi:MAG: hypothetical protein ACREGJ_01680 [Candidatus Saccharimonadales bacterium]